MSTVKCQLQLSYAARQLDQCIGYMYEQMREEFWIKSDKRQHWQILNLKNPNTVNSQSGQTSNFTNAHAGKH